ncbi:MAG: hypothetical protein ACK496_07920 [Acidobacteriota bacterium]
MPLSTLLLRTTFLVLVAASVGCRKEVDLDAGAPTPTPVVQQASPTPTPALPLPASPAPSASPTKPGEVPEMMKRAFTKEEMDKAMQQLPPEIRDRLKGMSYSPSNIPANIPATPPARKQ